MISEAILLCALAQAPWGFVDPLSVKAKLHTMYDLVKLDDNYPDYNWKFIDLGTLLKEEGWIPTPWVFKNWRIWATRDA